MYLPIFLLSVGINSGQHQKQVHGRRIAVSLDIYLLSESESKLCSIFSISLLGHFTVVQHSFHVAPGDLISISESQSLNISVPPDPQTLALSFRTNVSVRLRLQSPLKSEACQVHKSLIRTSCIWQTSLQYLLIHTTILFESALSFHIFLALPHAFHYLPNGFLLKSPGRHDSGNIRV
ncbi:hypothetical protein Tco_0554810 [Tanacetum coccineum]